MHTTKSTRCDKDPNHGITHLQFTHIAAISDPKETTVPEHQQNSRNRSR